MHEVYLRPNEAVRHLIEEHGVYREASTLQKYRTLGGGPKYVKIGRDVLYPVSELDHWAEKLRGRPMGSTAEHAKSAA